MMTFPSKARTGADGTLSLAIPTGIADAEVDVVVVIETARPAKLSDGWPEDFFDMYFGALKGEGLERPPQDNLEDRDALN